MINTRNISSFNLDVEREIDSYRRTYQKRYSEASAIAKKRIEKIDGLIYEIADLIKKDSFWRFIPPASFYYLSDFVYNGKEITFTINRVDNGTLSNHPTKQELLFYNKYLEQLSRLSTLLEKREKLLPPVNDKVIDFNSAPTKKDRIVDNQVKNTVVSYSNYMADDFVMKHHSDGISRLVKLLNDLEDTNDPYMLYTKMRTENIPPVYLHELLEWAATYSSKAQFILDKIAEDRMNRYYQTAGMPSKEDIMTNNIIKLHL